MAADSCFLGLPALCVEPEPTRWQAGWACVDNSVAEMVGWRTANAISHRTDSSCCADASRAGELSSHSIRPWKAGCHAVGSTVARGRCHPLTAMWLTNPGREVCHPREP